MHLETHLSKSEPSYADTHTRNQNPPTIKGFVLGTTWKVFIREDGKCDSNGNQEESTSFFNKSSEVRKSASLRYGQLKKISQSRTRICSDPQLTICNPYPPASNQLGKLCGSIFKLPSRHKVSFTLRFHPFKIWLNALQFK